jgi:hypothetical protein
MQQLAVRSFLQNGHEFYLFAYDTIDDVPPGTTVCEAREIFPRERVFSYQHGFGKGSYSAFSNLFRYQLLLERGGWWVDTDVVCLRPFDFDGEYVFASEHNDDFTVNAATCVVKAPARSPLLQYCVDVCLARGKEEIKWGDLGPSLLEEAIARFALGSCLQPVSAFTPINWFETADLLTPGFDIGRLRDSYAIHMWNQMWKHEGHAEETAGADSLYTYLQARFPAAG